VSDYRSLVARAKPGDTMLFLINRSGGTLFVPVEVPAKKQ